MPSGFCVKVARVAALPPHSTAGSAAGDPVDVTTRYRTHGPGQRRSIRRTRAFLRQTPGQWAALNGFVSYLRRAYGAELKMPATTSAAAGTRAAGEVVVDSRAVPAAREPWPPTRRSPRRLPQALTRPRHAAVSKTGPDGMRVRIAAIWW